MHDDDPDDVVHNLFAAPGLGRHPARPPDRRHRRVDHRADPRADPRASTGATTAPTTMVVAVGRQRRPRRRRTPGRARPSAATASSPASERARRRPRSAEPRPPRAPPAQVAHDAALRAGQPRARRERADPHRPAPLRARRAQHRARRRHLLAAVPGGARAPRPGLLRLLLRRHHADAGLVGVAGRLPARQASTTCSRRCATSSRKVAADGHHRGGARARQGPAARRPGARPRGLRLADVAARQGRARPRRAALASTRCSRRDSTAVTARATSRTRVARGTLHRDPGVTQRWPAPHG